MTGLNNFINLFGQVTLSAVVELVLAGVFLYLIYKKVRDFLIERYEAEKARDQRINEALDAVHKYADGKAATAETNAKTYADGLAVNYDAKGSATTAETNAKAYADGLNTTMDGRVAAVETALEVGTF